MTATPPSISCQVGRSRNATATAPPFAASIRQTATPQPRPTTWYALRAPTLPSPATRMSTPETIRPTMYAAGIADEVGDAGDRHGRPHRSHPCPSVAEPSPTPNLLLDELLQLLRRLDELVDQVEHDVAHRAHVVHAADDLPDRHRRQLLDVELVDPAHRIVDEHELERHRKGPGRVF